MDDCIVYRFGADSFMIVVNAPVSPAILPPCVRVCPKR